MASQTIYAPTVNNYEPAFQVGQNCRIYFKLSDFNKISDIANAHATVLKLSNNQNVVNKAMNQTDVVRSATGMLLNLPIGTEDAKKGIYYIDILNNYINDNGNGFTEGSLYKVQIRLVASPYVCDGSTNQEQSAWLADSENTANFSEWSTVIIIKATGEVSLSIPLLNNEILKSSNLDINGTYSNTDKSEKLSTIRFVLYNNDSFIIEDSGIIYVNKFGNTNNFAYKCKTNLEANFNYSLKVFCTTINKLSFEKIYSFRVEPPSLGVLENLYLSCVKNMKGYEEDEGCIIVKITSTIPEDTFQGTLRIRRSSSKDGFSTWEDIYEIRCISNTLVDNILPFADFTIESGVYYKYGLQKIIYEDNLLKRSELKEMPEEQQRVFEYSYLLGQDTIQLKLKYDATLSSFNKTYSETITPTIGGKYPFITRVGNADYYTFNINGKISFNMDDNHLFLTKNFLYGYNKNDSINKYDYTYEREFRKKVYEFLTDGKPKLFKSPTEGNLIVRLTNVGLSPEQSLSRLIYNFSATATEIDDAEIENYKKYHFIPELDIDVM